MFIGEFVNKRKRGGRRRVRERRDLNDNLDETLRTRVKERNDDLEMPNQS